MCGRFNLIADVAQVCASFELERVEAYQPRFNIAPGQAILNITQLPDDNRQAAYCHWGLIPSWAKDSKMSSHLINARAETLSEKPSFRAAYKQRHCLLPATGFYEWAQTAHGKQAYHISREDGELFAFAGLWEYWEHAADIIYSCTIITTAANALLQPIHTRMPVIIAPQQYAHWLDASQTPASLQALLAQDAYAAMTVKPISARVNNPWHDDADCLH